MNKKWWKKLFLLTVCLFTLSFFSGCQKEAVGETGKSADVSQKTQEDAWMDEETVGEEEYFDVEDVGNDEVDYSGYEEKKTTNPGEAVISDGTDTGTDQYGTEPIPAGQQKPVEPEDAKVDKEKSYTCYLSISCRTILDNMGDLKDGKESVVPSDGIIYERKAVTFYEGESVFDVLKRETRKHKIHLDYAFTPGYNSNYIRGINNIYERDCGDPSGWLYFVNGWAPNYGCSRYAVQDGDEIEWEFTCDGGSDLGVDI